MWNPSCNPSHPPPSNPTCPPDPFPTPTGAQQWNPGFHPGRSSFRSLPCSIPPPGPGMCSVNPLVPGIVGSGIMIDKKVHERMKKHSSSSSFSSSSSSSDSD
ncbi:hypothetical protein JEQ12_002185 [Ovis aries]|uniref:Uncharacterized protein n=1 Tax=Ovis aries TaxID=9940 RepID=A0A835ZZP4_SHEEP|nr:hypothetical protein JEQ12_002185 [Ovis aries]